MAEAALRINTLDFREPEGLMEALLTRAASAGLHWLSREMFRPATGSSPSPLFLKPPKMDYNAFYTELFQPIEKAYGPIDVVGIFHIIGFDCGGPINFSTVGAQEKKEFVTYVTCELSVREEQIPSSCGRFELLCDSNDEAWVRSVLTDLARMTLREQFDHGHTVDVSASIEGGNQLNGLILERLASVEIGSVPYCILRVHGIFNDEMQLAMDEGADALFARLKEAGVYPRTFSARSSTARRSNPE